MAFLIGGANSAADTGYDVANSCRFNDADTAYMHKTNSGSASDGQKFTFSAWFKRGNNIGTSDDPTICGTNVDTSGNNFGYIVRITDDQLEFLRDYIGSSDQAHKKANHKLKDPHAWYHVVVAVDTTQGTAANRNRCYLNGTEITSFATDTNYDQNDTTAFNRDKLHLIGAKKNEDAVNNHYEGYLAEVCMIDGTQYAASDFGEFDEDSPTIWKPKDVSGLTFGNNGFYLDFEDSANLGNDKNGGTDLTEVTLAATDQSSDSPTNNFCTLNPLTLQDSDFVLSEGNLKISIGGNNERKAVLGTFGLTSGKWYYECKYISTSGQAFSQIGISDIIQGTEASSENGKMGYFPYDYGYRGELSSGSGGLKTNNGTYTSYGDAWTTDDIIGVAFDLDNNAIYFAKNGAWQASGDPTSGASRTNAAYNITAAASTGTGAYFPAIGKEDADDPIFEFNFGGTNSASFAISSGNADGNGYGNFEYAPPSGYYALCTKNLAEFG